jgi:hypothetical protein
MSPKKLWAWQSALMSTCERFDDVRVLRATRRQGLGAYTARREPAFSYYVCRALRHAEADVDQPHARIKRSRRHAVEGFAVSSCRVICLALRSARTCNGDRKTCTMTRTFCPARCESVTVFGRVRITPVSGDLRMQVQSTISDEAQPEQRLPTTLYVHAHVAMLSVLTYAT